MRNNQQSKKAFTLVELLIVIGIIALLTGILLPVLSIARARAKDTVCQSQIKQIAYSFEYYLDKWDDTYPYAHEGSHYEGSAPWDYTTGRIGWFTRLNDYLQSPEVFNCPSAPLEFCWDGGPLNQNSAGGFSFCYGWNNLPFWTERGMADSPFTHAKRTKRGTIRHPAQMYVFMDSRGDGWRNNYCVRPLHEPELPGRRHRDGANIAFADGHVGWETFEKLIDEGPDSRFWMIDCKPLDTDVISPLLPQQ